MPKFRIIASRFINGVYIHATPDEPQIIDVEIPAGRKPDGGLFPLDAPIEKPKQQYVDRKKQGNATAANHFGTPLAEKDDEPEEKNEKKGAAKRASDTDAI